MRDPYQLLRAWEGDVQRRGAHLLLGPGGISARMRGALGVRNVFFLFFLVRVLGFSRGVGFCFRVLGGKNWGLFYGPHSRFIRL